MTMGWVLAIIDPEKSFVFSVGNYLYPGQYLVVASKLQHSDCFSQYWNVIEICLWVNSSGETIGLYNNSGMTYRSVRTLTYSMVSSCLRFGPS
jgi:hypothetical protein